MDTEAQAAFARFVREMSESLSRLAATLEGGESPGGSHYGPAHLKLPWAERVLRQSLIVQDILSEGGNVTKERWYEIAAKYGYSGRGLAGFFRGGNQGLLEMRKERVYVTKHGKERLAQNLSRVEGARETESAA
jgi:hypothetical protein